MGRINFVDAVNIKQVHEELMSKVRTKVIYISSNKYKIQIEPVHGKILPTLEKDFPEMLNEVLSYNNEQQLPNSNNK